MSKVIKEERDSSEEVKNAQMTTECIGKMVDNIECRVSAKMQKMYFPALAIFSSVVIGMFAIIYSITVDMNRVADSMSQGEGVAGMMGSVSSNMTEMTKIMAEMSKNVGQMNSEFKKTNVLLAEMNKDIKHLGAMKDIAGSIGGDVTKLTEAVASIKDINTNISQMTHGVGNMDRSVYEMGSDIRNMKRSFNGPLNIMNKMKMPF